MFHQNFSKISFYIVAHADDWQLFMQPNAFNDIVSAESKTVFIVTTAGDAGFDKEFWLAREEGMKSSIKFCLAPHVAILETEKTWVHNRHSIYSSSINNTTCYFFRLPDGNLDGNGFSAFRFQSLEKFRSGQNQIVEAVDNSTTYSNWQDLTVTLRSIIDFESDGIENKWINYINPDDKINPNDHRDHIATGNLVNNIAGISQLKQALFVGYSVSGKNCKLTQTEFFWKSGMFSAYEKTMFELTGYSTLKEDVQTYLNWCASGPDIITMGC